MTVPSRLCDLTSHQYTILFEPWTDGELRDIALQSGCSFSKHPNIATCDRADIVKLLVRENVNLGAMLSAMENVSPLVVRGWHTTLPCVRSYIGASLPDWVVVVKDGPSTDIDVSPSVQIHELCSDDAERVLRIIGRNGCAAAMRAITPDCAATERISRCSASYASWGGITQQSCIQHRLLPSTLLKWVWEQIPTRRFHILAELSLRTVFIPLLNPWLAQWISRIPRGTTVIAEKTLDGTAVRLSIDSLKLRFPVVFKAVAVAQVPDPEPEKRSKPSDAPDAKRVMDDARRAKYYPNDRMSQIDPVHRWVLECTVRTRVREFVMNLQARMRPRSLALLDRFVCAQEGGTHARELVECLCEQEQTLTVGNVIVSMGDLNPIERLSGFPAFKDLVEAHFECPGDNEEEEE